MPAPYSCDLRQKVIDALERDMAKSEASRVFAMSRNTIDLWLKRRQQTGELKAKQGYQQGSCHKITNWERFRQFAQAHGGRTQAEMAHLWEGDISQRTIDRALAKIGFTRKKRPTATSNGIKPNAKHQKRSCMLMSPVLMMPRTILMVGLNGLNGFMPSSLDIEPGVAE